MEIDLKQVLKEEANWKHYNFGDVAAFISGLGVDGVIELKESYICRESTNTQ